jgi:uncharacterized protein HemX
MFPNIGTKMIISLAAIVLVLLASSGIYLYVKHLQASVITLKNNNDKLNTAIEEQKNVIVQQKSDVKKIVRDLKSYSSLNTKLSEEINDLKRKFNKIDGTGKKRDIGELAEAKPKIIENTINNASQNVLRCFEVATGSNLTESEKNAKTNSKINPECPSLFDSGNISSK